MKVHDLWYIHISIINIYSMQIMLKHKHHHQLYIALGLLSIEYKLSSTLQIINLINLLQQTFKKTWSRNEISSTHVYRIDCKW